MKKNCKTKKYFIVGSAVFFYNMDDFDIHDIDEIQILDYWPFKINSLLSRNNGKDVFYYKDMDKYEFIADSLIGNLSMKLGKFLVPNFIEYIGLTIDDLQYLKPLIYKLDERHLYEKVIFESYIENNGFYLTNDQLNKAYKVYKEARKKNPKN